MKYRILIVDDEENICFTLKRFLTDEGYDVSVAGSCKEALNELGKDTFDLVFADILLKGRSGIDLLREIRDKRQNCPVVMITGAPDIETASEAVRLGAFDYLSKPVLQNALLRVANAALKHKAIVDENERYRTNLEAIFKSVRDGIITVDTDLRIIETNSAVKKLCNFSRENAVGKPIRSLLPGCSGKCVGALDETINKRLSTRINTVKCECRRHPDQVVSVDASPLIGVAGRLSGGILVIRDETRLQNLEKSLKERTQFHNLVGKNRKMQEIYSLIDNLADLRTTVLITGESGTGKELVAEALHYLGSFSGSPFVKVNCSALAENLLESELFGHVKGAFSGAVKDRIGRFQIADGGTLFLDEIGEISPRMQLALLRVLQEKMFERVGDASPIKVDVRIVAATNRNLMNDVLSERFRRDLYYRLKVIELGLPPLRERRDDMPLLLKHFIDQLNRQYKRNITGVSNRVKDMFFRYEWPGNVRELKNVLEHAFILCRQKTIEAMHLPSEFCGPTTLTKGEAERLKILATLDNSHWNKTKAAEILGMSRQSLYRKMKMHAIDD